MHQSNAVRTVSIRDRVEGTMSPTESTLAKSIDHNAGLMKSCFCYDQYGQCPDLDGHIDSSCRLQQSGSVQDLGTCSPLITIQQHVQFRSRGFGANVALESPMNRHGNPRTIWGKISWMQVHHRRNSLARQLVHTASYEPPWKKSEIAAAREANSFRPQ